MDLTVPVFDSKDSIVPAEWPNNNVVPKKGGILSEADKSRTAPDRMPVLVFYG
jgi:hypothetical protein